MACCNKPIGKSTVERSVTGSSNLRTTSKNGHPLRIRKHKIAVSSATKPANSLDKRS